MAARILERRIHAADEEARPAAGEFIGRCDVRYFAAMPPCMGIFADRGNARPEEV